jgi:hypothetical protein
MSVVSETVDSRFLRSFASRRARADISLSAPARKGERTIRLARAKESGRPESSIK